MKKALLLTDNEYLLSRFVQLAEKLPAGLCEFTYAYSFNNKALAEKYKNESWIQPLKIKERVQELVNTYSIVFSLHCKQIFPAALVQGVKCINIHPGLNPYNRGWYPQIFSIINGLPCGATIHEIDEQLDHGPIIAQQEVKITSWDTSLSVYNKVLQAELELLDQHLVSIIKGDYKTTIPAEGNLNLVKDFEQLRQLDLNDTDTFQNHINKLRALSHGTFNNAWFIDKEGNKIFIRVELTKEGQ